MKEYVLNYYSEFNCIAQKCKHTCCAGWEIDIDKDSLTAYKNDKSNFSPTLKSGINFRKSKFKYDKHKRCAFLNDKGLCEIINNLGEKCLCQVCRDHPRFRSFFDDRTEMGLGFCCEEVSRIVLSFTDKIEPILISDDSIQTELDFNQKNVLNFRKKALDIIQEQSTNINDRIERLLKTCNATFSKCDLKRILKTFLSFEHIDKNWINALKSINVSIFKDTNNALSHYCEQFLANSLYRHLSDAEDTMWVRARTIACVVSWGIINNIVSQKLIDKQNLLDVIIDTVRTYSTEVEYSQKNLNKLFSLCYKFIKI